jgi:hypothetical protein
MNPDPVLTGSESGSGLFSEVGSGSATLPVGYTPLHSDYRNAKQRHGWAVKSVKFLCFQALFVFTEKFQNLYVFWFLAINKTIIVIYIYKTFQSTFLRPHSNNKTILQYYRIFSAHTTKTHWNFSSFVDDPRYFSGHTVCLSIDLWSKWKLFFFFQIGLTLQ